MKTCTPPAAVTLAMPRPIAPVPITPTIRSGRVASIAMISLLVVGMRGATARASTALELRLALLHERRLPFLVVLAREAGIHHALACVEVPLGGVLLPFDQ